ncbi:MAG: DUF1499 domain-containing protein [Methylocaldum sp.]|jgi:uncharacterized protein (DUF1499 family)|uniref:DUF1499 domain-containing protein n=1 Tax=unclassified Methylocaldum TaxID=2622260 RepID=UPI00143A8FAC|nr:DUF1499 domain-containing protein [Methylocaldum sp. 14B]MDV3240245.1 DUF1499 domain-containing protein [Methylocaldum sp.]
MASSRISDCPDSPNCVSSLSRDQDHYASPFRVDIAPDEAWAALKRVLGAEPRTRVVEEDNERWYLRAEATSRLFRFVDDVEFQLIPEEHLMHVRSASRVGYWDLGVNRRRVERLREALKREGLWR